jgi:hypothetical protein
MTKRTGMHGRGRGRYKIRLLRRRIAFGEIDFDVDIEGIPERVFR